MILDHVQLAMPGGGEAEARRFFVHVLEMAEQEKPPVLRARGGCWFRKDQCIVHVGVDPDFKPTHSSNPIGALG